MGFAIPFHPLPLPNFPFLLPHYLPSFPTINKIESICPWYDDTPFWSKLYRTPKFKVFGKLMSWAKVSLGPFVRHWVGNLTHYIRCDGQYALMYLSKRFHFLKFHSCNGQMWNDHLCNYASYYIWYHMLPYVDGEVDPSLVVASPNKCMVCEYLQNVIAMLACD